MHPTVKRLIRRTPGLGSLLSSRDQALRDLEAQQVSLHEHQRSLGEYQEALARTERSLRDHQTALREARQAFIDYRNSLDRRFRSRRPDGASRL